MKIGLDIGGTKILGGLFDNKKLVNTFKLKTKANEGTDDILERIYKVIDELLKGDISLEGIGVGIPGNIDIKTGVIKVSPNLPFENFPLKEKLSKKYKVPVAVENDVNVGLLGEHWTGAATKYKNVVGIFVGTGIGGAIIINNNLIHGKHNIAGELGHITLQIDGPKCNCGNKGCFEAHASKLAMQKQLESEGLKFEKIIKSSQLKEGLNNNDKTIKIVLKKASTALGEAIGSITNILNPEAIILGGGVIEAVGDYMLKRIEPIAESRAMVKPNILLSKLGDDALLYGAVKLVS